MEYLSVEAAQQCVLETVAALGAEPVKLEQSPGARAGRGSARQP